MVSCSLDFAPVMTTQEFKELREFAKRALANQELRIESKYKREQADKVATEVTAAVKKEKGEEEHNGSAWTTALVVEAYVYRHVRNGAEAWDRKEKALRWLLDRALRACEHVKAVVRCQAFLQAKAERALRVGAADVMSFRLTVVT